MPLLATEGNWNREFLIWSLGEFSEETITIIAGAGVIPSGRMLGKIAVGTASSAAKSGGNTGNGTMGAVTVGSGAKAGVYTLRIITAVTNAGRFRVVDPDGNEVGEGNVAAAFSGGGLSFTLADGSTDFVAGDGFDITVAAGSGKYDNYDDTATNGTDKCAGILLDGVDASGSDDVQAVAIVRHALVKDTLVTAETSGHKTAGKADLAPGFIIFR